MNKLAIVIPYYKITFFEDVLQSLVNQTNKNFNVYIGNDNSPDPPQELVEGYRNEFNLKYIKFNDNLGSVSLTKQWERCIDLVAAEEWIMLLGDDDVLENNVVNEFYSNLNIIEEKAINVVRFASKLIDITGQELSAIYKHDVFELATDAYYRKFKWESRSSLSEYIFRTSSYIKKGFTNYPLAWHSDDKAWLDFTNSGLIYTCNDAVVNIRRSNENISGKTDNLDRKNKAAYQFFNDITTSSKYTFTKKQKTTLLLEYGALLKQQKQITGKHVFRIAFQFIKIGAFYNGLRFIRRMYRSKFLKK